MRLRDAVRFTEDKNKTKELQRQRMLAIRDKNSPDYGKVRDGVLEAINNHPGCGHRDMVRLGFKEGSVYGAINRVQFMELLIG